jgi:hypothetical protein
MNRGAGSEPAKDSFNGLRAKSRGPLLADMNGNIRLIQYPMPGTVLTTSGNRAAAQIRARSHHFQTRSGSPPRRKPRLEQPRAIASKEQIGTEPPTKGATRRHQSHLATRCDSNDQRLACKSSTDDPGALGMSNRGIQVGLTSSDYLVASSGMRRMKVDQEVAMS